MHVDGCKGKMDLSQGDASSARRKRRRAGSAGDDDNDGLIPGQLRTDDPSPSSTADAFSMRPRLEDEASDNTAKEANRDVNSQLGSISEGSNHGEPVGLDAGAQFVTAQREPVDSSTSSANSSGMALSLAQSEHIAQGHQQASQGVVVPPVGSLPGVHLNTPSAQAQNALQLIQYGATLQQLGLLPLLNMYGSTSSLQQSGATTMGAPATLSLQLPANVISGTNPASQQLAPGLLSHLATVIGASAVTGEPAAGLPALSSSLIPQSQTSAVLYPQTWDVVLGRGKKFRFHPGNMRMHLIVHLHKPAYSKADNREGKAEITRRIVDFIQSRSGGRNGRFLEFKNEWNKWERVDDDTARRKVSHAFRDRRRNERSVLGTNDPDILREIKRLETRKLDATDGEPSGEDEPTEETNNNTRFIAKVILELREEAKVLSTIFGTQPLEASTEESSEPTKEDRKGIC